MAVQADRRETRLVSIEEVQNCTTFSCQMGLGCMGNGGNQGWQSRRQVQGLAHSAGFEAKGIRMRSTGEVSLTRGYHLKEKPILPPLSPSLFVDMQPHHLNSTSPLSFRLCLSVSLLSSLRPSLLPARLLPCLRLAFSPALPVAIRVKTASPPTHYRPTIKSQPIMQLLHFGLSPKRHRSRLMTVSPWSALPIASVASGS